MDGIEIEYLLNINHFIGMKRQNIFHDKYNHVLFTVSNMPEILWIYMCISNDVVAVAALVYVHAKS